MKDRPQNSRTTLEIVQAHNTCWGRGDLNGCMALYHKDMVFVDHFSACSYSGSKLQKHVASVLARSRLETLTYLDRVRVDGDTAFLQYQESILSSQGSSLMQISACDTVRVHAGLIMEINEYAFPMGKLTSSRKFGHQIQAEKIGLSARALGFLIQDLCEYFERKKPFLDSNLSLADVAMATGYTRNQISYALNHGLGKSFHQFLAEERIKAVLAMPLALTGNRIWASAQKAGFKSPSTFYACFRKLTGLTPGQYLAHDTGR